MFVILLKEDYLIFIKSSFINHIDTYNNQLIYFFLNPLVNNIIFYKFH